MLDNATNSRIADHTENGSQIAADPNFFPPQADAAPNPFDPESLRLDQSFSDGLAVKKILTVVPVRKPGKQEFVRVRPGTEWRLETAILESESDRESYIVASGLRADLVGEFRPAALFTSITRHGDLFLWRCWLPESDGRANSWTDSLLDAARLAESQWVRVRANMRAGLYDVEAAAGNIPEPEWPAHAFPELLRLAFAKRIIDTADHPILRALRGEA